MRKNSDQTMQAWLEGAQQLSLEGRLAWLLGESLQEALTMQQEPSLDAAQVRSRLDTLIRSTLPWSNTPELTPQEKVQDNKISRPAKDTSSSSSWQKIATDRLDNRSLPIVAVSSATVRGKWACLAMGVDGHGKKHIIGGRDDADVTQLVLDLASRGLSGADGLFLITDGSSGVDQAAKMNWKNVCIQHCLLQLRKDLSKIAPVQLAPAISEAIAVAQRASVPEAALALGKLLTLLHKEHPGAAARLERSRQSALRAAHLTQGSLRRKLQTLSILRYAWTQAKGYGKSLDATANLMAWMSQVDRIDGSNDLPEFLRQLQENGKQDLN